MPHLVEPVDPLPMEGVDAAIRLAPPARVSAEHVMGKYIISDKPMTEEQWIREHATVVDGEATEVTPALEDKKRSSD